jgi:hypothetical protein
MQGDFDGDGKIDLTTYNPTTATWTFTDSSRGGSSFVFGTPKTSVPIVGNFDGPGVTEIGVFDIVNNLGQWTISTPTGGLRSVTFGLPGDIPEPGDYDGVNKDELAVYRPSTGQFVVYECAGSQVKVISIPGLVPNSSLVPVPGQYDNLYYSQHGQTYRPRPLSSIPPRARSRSPGRPATKPLRSRRETSPSPPITPGLARFRRPCSVQAPCSSSRRAQPDRTRSLLPSRLLLRQPSSR